MTRGAWCQASCTRHAGLPSAHTAACRPTPAPSPSWPPRRPLGEAEPPPTGPQLLRVHPAPTWQVDTGDEGNEQRCLGVCCGPSGCVTVGVQMVAAAARPPLLLQPGFCLCPARPPLRLVPSPTVGTQGPVLPPACVAVAGLGLDGLPLPYVPRLLAVSKEELSQLRPVADSMGFSVAQGLRTTFTFLSDCNRIVRTVIAKGRTVCCCM